MNKWASLKNICERERERESEGRGRERGRGREGGEREREMEREREGETLRSMSRFARSKLSYMFSNLETSAALSGSSCFILFPWEVQVNPPLRLSSLRHDHMGAGPLWFGCWFDRAGFNSVCTTGDQSYGEWQRGAKESWQFARNCQKHVSCDAVKRFEL